MQTAVQILDKELLSPKKNEAYYVCLRSNEFQRKMTTSFKSNFSFSQILSSN